MSLKFNPILGNLNKTAHDEVGGLKRAIELGEDLNAGDPVYLYDDSGIPKVKKVFSFAQEANNYEHALYGATCKIDNNTFVIAFRDIDDANKGKVMVGSIQPDNSIIWGQRFEFFSGIAYNLSIATIAKNKFVICYRGSSNFASARVGIVSGTTISLGTETQVNAAYSLYISSAQINTDKFVVAYYDGGDSGKGKAKVCSVSGTTITPGAAGEFSPVTTYFTFVTGSGINDKFVVFYRASSGYGYAKATTVTGITIDGFGPEATFNQGTTSIHSCTDINADKVVVTYSDASNGSQGTVVVGRISGTNISFGDEYIFSPTITYYSWVDKQDSDQIIVSYSYNQYESARVRQGDVVNDEISWGNQQTYHDAGIYITWITSLETNKYLITWSDSTSYEGYALVVEDGALNTLDDCIGILEESGDSGDEKVVSLLGSVTYALTGMTAGENMYIQNDGSISNITSNNQIGLALSDSDMLISKLQGVSE